MIVNGAEAGACTFAALPGPYLVLVIPRGVLCSADVGTLVPRHPFAADCKDGPANAGAACDVLDFHLH